ncbi:MAG: GNAT family N-acetyltransferase [Pirellulaceae bacterium]
MHGVTVRQDLDWCIEDILRACGLAAWNFDHLISSQKAFHAYHYLLDDSPYIALNDGFEEYLTRRRGMSSTCVVQAQRKLRKLDREVGPVRFELHTGDSSVFDRLVEWKRAQLGRPSMFELDWVVPVLRRIAYTDNGPRFRGLLSALYAGDDLVAVHLGIHAGPVVASWIPTYSQKFARFSPGLLIHLELARSVSAQGVRRIELGRGTNQLKRGLASGARPVAIGRVDACPSARVVRKRWARVKAGIRESPRYRFLYEIYRMCRRRMSTSA